MSQMTEIPQKRFYKIGEVCQYTDTQPYVVRFWESEFPQLAPDKSRGGQPVYSRADIELILRIKQLLYDEEYSLEDARRALERERKRRGSKGARGGKIAATPAKRATPMAEVADTVRNDLADNVSPAREPAAASGGQERSEVDTISRARYEDAVDEVAHLRLKLQEIESQLRKASSQLEQTQETAEEYRERYELAVSRLEQILDRLGG